MTGYEEGRRVSRLIGGAILIAVGGLLVLGNLGAVPAGNLGDYWPMLLVWVGATRMFAPGRGEHVVSGLIVLSLGVFFQLDRFGLIGVSLGDLWPVFLIAGGAAMVFEGLRARRTGVAEDGGSR